MSKWVSVGKYGLRYREHPDKTVGVGRKKRPLRYYTAVYKHKGKTMTDAYGWEGIDYKNEDKVVTTAILLRQNRRDKTPPFTLKELHADRQKALDELEAEKKKEIALAERKDSTKLDRVFDAYCSNNSHKKSLRDEKSYYKNWIKTPLGQKRLDQITLLDLERIKKEMLTAGKAIRSIQYIKSIVRQLYNYASERNIYSGSPPTLHFLKKQKVDNRRQRYLSPEEASLLLEKIRETSEQTYSICLMSLNTGMRFGEIAALQWQHVITERREILVVDPKNTETRSVYMTDTIFELFMGMNRGEPSDLVFPSRKSEQMTSVSKTFSRAVISLGLNEGIIDRRLKVVFHTLRHSCASWLANSGTELAIIAKILGHKSLQMTMRYSHINDNSVKNAMSELDRNQISRPVQVIEIEDHR